MAAASAVMLETGRKLSESVTYLIKLSGNNMLPGFDAHQSKSSTLTTPEHKPEIQSETLPSFEGYDNNLVTLPEVHNSNLEGFTAIPIELINDANILYSKKADVKDLEVGTYGDLAKRSIKDGLTPDHIPSFAAIERAKRDVIGGQELSPKERKALRKVTNSIVYDTDLHQKYSRTYGGRNTKKQIELDAKDLYSAQERDLTRLKKVF